MSFQRMLSNQVAERHASEQAESAREANKSSAPTKSEGSAKPDNSQAANASDNNKDAAAPSEAKKAAKAADDDDGKGDKDDKQAAKESDATPPTATELIAMALGHATAAQNTTKPEAKTDNAVTERGKKLEDPLHQTGKSAAGGDAANALTAKAEKAAAAVAGDHETFSAAMRAKENAAPNTTPAAVPAQLQQAGVDMAQAASGHVDRLTPRVGTPAWDQALGQKVVWMVGGSQQSASLTLNPPDLGPLQVVLNVSNGQADASFYAAQPEVRQALEAALPKLRDMMSDAGVQLAQTSVSAGMPDQFNQPGNHNPQQSSRSFHANASQADTPVQSSRIQAISSGLGLVDTFA